MMKRYIFILLTAVAAASCSDKVTAPDGGVNETELKFLRFRSTSAVTTRQASFFAVRGQSRKVEMNYADGRRFLRFSVNSNSLLAAPDGRLYLNGDSVRISVSLDASNRMIVRFEPSGLKFNPLSPAKLEINFEGKDDDIDGDGDLDQNDSQLDLLIKVWKQEQPGLPWLPQATFRIDDDDAEAQILSFTGFAMAS